MEDFSITLDIQKPSWLIERLFKNKQSPIFAFRSTVNWMHALALLTTENNFSDANLKEKYSNTQRRSHNIESDNLVFENILMALNYLSSLETLKNTPTRKQDIVHIAIVSWYYSIYFSTSAMIAGASGKNSETHTGTAKIMQSDLIQSKILISPFDFCLNSLVKKDIEKDIQLIRPEPQFDINGKAPSNQIDAWGAVLKYLKGTANWQREKIEAEIKSSKEFKQQKYSDFRKKRAQHLRDEKLRKKSINFLTQCFRYRGKANYRDAVYLTYENTSDISPFIDDLYTVAEKYLRMSVHYLNRRVEKGTWDLFTEDIEDKTQLSHSTDILKV